MWRSATNATKATNSAVSVITGADHPTGLGTARSLAGIGCRIIGFYKNRTPSTRSKHWDQLIHIDFWANLLSYLIELGKSLEGKAALFITQDSVVKLVSDNWPLLEPYYHCPMPSAKIVDTLLDKVLFHDWAKRNQFQVPDSWICHNREELDQCLATSCFPVIIKPYEKTAVWNSFSPQAKAFVLHSREDVEQVPFDLFRATPKLLVQQWILGGDRNIFYCLVYYDKQGHCVSSFAGRKLFQWPVRCGDTAATVSIQNPVIEETTRRLFDLAGYHGLGSVEYKLNDADGRYYVIEATVGRNDLQSNIALAGGVNLTATAFADMFDLPLPQPGRRKASWISEEGLLEAIRVGWREKSLCYQDLARLCKLHVEFAHWSWRDPAPGFCMLAKLLQRRFGLVAKTKR